MVLRERQRGIALFWGCLSAGCYITHFGGKHGQRSGRRKETGEQGAHKNVQEGWLYIRAFEILLARERREEEWGGCDASVGMHLHDTCMARVYVRLCVVYSGWPKGIFIFNFVFPSQPATYCCLFTWIAHWPKGSKNTHNWLRALDALDLLSPSYCAMTWTNCAQPPLKQNHVRPLGFWWQSSFYGRLGRTKMGQMLQCVLEELDSNWQSTPIDFLAFSQGSSKHNKSLECAFCFPKGSSNERKWGWENWLQVLIGYVFLLKVGWDNIYCTSLISVQ